MIELTKHDNKMENIKYGCRLSTKVSEEIEATEMECNILEQWENSSGRFHWALPSCAVTPPLGSRY